MINLSFEWLEERPEVMLVFLMAFPGLLIGLTAATA